MNQEDDKIKKLFQQIREDDERNAPSFTHDWNSAMHGMDKPRRRWPAWQMAAGVAALLILAGTGLWILIRPASNEIENGELIIENAESAMLAANNSSIPSDNSQFSTVNSQLPSNVVRRVSSSSLPVAAMWVTHARFRATSPSRVYRPTPSAGSRQQAILISQWRSPTESFLRTPGEQLFKRVPRLDESVVNIKTTISNQKN